MASDPRSRWKQFQWFLDFMVVFVLLVAAIGLTAPRFKGFLDFDMAPVHQMSVALLVVTLCWLASWFFTIRHEPDLLKEAGEEFIPLVPKSILLLLLVLGFLLGLLTYFSNRPLIYSGIFVTLRLLQVWFTWFRDIALKEALKKARRLRSPEDERCHQLNVIDWFYLGLPQVPLIVTASCLGVISIVMAVYGELLSEPQARRIFTSIAYSSVILAVLGEEAVFMIWRSQRAKRLASGRSEEDPKIRIGA